MYLETEHLYIRNFTKKDIDALYEIKYDRQVFEYIPDFLERGVTKCKLKSYIDAFQMLEETQDYKSWRIYAIVDKKSGEVMGSLSFSENELLHEYELGWQMISRYTKKGYASEAAAAFAEFFCEQNKVDYIIVVMDTDNPASYRTAEKSGFQLFEKRTVYDCTDKLFYDDYYYFRRYYSKSTLSEKFYGDNDSYDGRSAGSEPHEVERIVEKTLGRASDSISRVENVPNNTVYRIESSGERYILKFYRHNWPEDGKIPFVNRMLVQYGIPCAELIEFNRSDPEYPAGYIMEREICGIGADQICFNRNKEIALYTKLAVLLSHIHNIPIRNFGYIGSGEADYDSMLSFFQDEFDDRTDDLIHANVYTKAEIRKMKDKFLETLRRFNDLPSVLCHGDLSKKNIIVDDNGDLILIDWDDAMSYNWMADLSRLTFWMKFNYDHQDYDPFRKVLLEHYHTIHRKSEFDDFESAFHIYVGLDSLSYHINMGNTMMQKHIMDYLNQLNRQL